MQQSTGESPGQTEYSKHVLRELEEMEPLLAKLYDQYRTKSAVQYEYWRQNKSILDRVLKDQTNRLSVPDLGCGFGTFIGSAEKFAQVVGIDVSPHALRIARLEAPDGLIILGDAGQLPFSSGVFDVVVSKGVLHHVPSVASVIREAHRVLKPQGRFIILEGNADSVYRRTVLKIADVLHIEHDTSGCKHIPASEIVGMLTENGFDVDEVVNLSGMFLPLRAYPNNLLY